MNARLSASGPIALATLIASLWSSSAAGPPASLAHRDLDAEGLLSGCDTVGCKAVVVPGEMYGGGVLVAPATDAIDRPLPPAPDPSDESPGMRRRMSPVVQHQSPEPTTSHPVPQPGQPYAKAPTPIYWVYENFRNDRQSGSP